MKKNLTDQARKAFEITQYYLDNNLDLDEALITALTHVEDKPFREEFKGFPYIKLDNYEITSISNEIEKFIQDINSEIITLKDIFINIKNKEKILKKYKIDYKVEEIKEGKFENLNSLLKYGYDLVLKAEENLLDPVIGRKNEISRIIHILSRKIKNNALIVGEAGVGKTALVEAIAQKIAKKEAGSLNNKRIVSLDLNSIVAGTKFRGDFEERMQEIIEVLRKNPDIILFVDEIHKLIGHSGQDYGNILKPYLSRGEIQVIGATTNKEYRDIFQKEKALDRRFQSVMIQESTAEETLDIIKNISHIYENFHNVKLSNNIIDEIVTLCERYMTYRNFPDKAIDLLDELCSFHKAEIEKPQHIINIENDIDNTRKLMIKEKLVDQYLYFIDILKKEKLLKENIINFNKDKNTKKQLELEDLYKVFYQMTSIPVGNIKIKEKEILLSLEKNLNNKIIGQTEAIKNISKSIVRSKLGYIRKNKPLASFLFVGPSGVGKTLSAEVLANILFPHQRSYKRFDMSEYVESHSISKLVGSPRGYVGFGEGGFLTNYVKENPYSILLFDEMEKANKTIENLMLQLLDNGTVSDTNDETINFSNTIIIYTTNCLIEFKEKNSLGFLDTKLKDDTKHSKLFKELTNTFRQEFLNRIDYIVLFNNIDDNGLKQIVDLEIDKLAKEYLTKLNINITKEVKEFILNKLQRKNARYITKTIQAEIIDQLITKSLENKIDLEKEIKVFIKEDKIQFKYGKKKI